MSGNFTTPPLPSFVRRKQDADQIAIQGQVDYFHSLRESLSGLRTVEAVETRGHFTGY